MIEEEGHFSWYNELSDELEDKNLHFSLPFSFFLACSRLEHYNEMGGPMGASKTYNNAKRFYYWPGMIKWICALTDDFFTCQNNEPEPKHRIEVPLEEWQSEVVPIRKIHVDHKGRLHRSNNRDFPCLLVKDAFSCFLMLYPVTSTGAQASISVVQKWIKFFGIARSIVLD